MKNMLFSFLVCLVPILLNAQSQAYSKAKIFLYNNSINELAELGLEVDHGEHMPHRWIISDYSHEEIDLVREAGFEYEILIEDVVAYYQDPNRGEHLETTLRGNGCSAEVLDSFNIYPYKTPLNYTGGTYQGYYLYQEMLDHHVF